MNTKVLSSLRRIALIGMIFLGVSCKTRGELVVPDRPGEGVQLREEQMSYIQVIPAEKDALGASLHTTGRVSYDEDRVARIAAPITGRIVELKVGLGDQVKAGQVLAVVHSPDIAAAQASLAQDRAQRVQAEHSHARTQRLLSAGAGSDREVEEATVSLAQAKAAEERDVATLRVLGGGSMDPSPVYQVKSPIVGTVTERKAALGAVVNAGDSGPLFVVGDLNRLWVVIDVFEQDIALVHKDARVEVSVPAYPDKVFGGKVTLVGDTVDPTTRTVKVRIAMDNEDRSLKPEMFASVTVWSSTHGAVRIPESSILTKGDKTYVFVEKAPRDFVVRQVTLGARQEDTIQVLHGIAPGERVASKGALLLDSEMGQRI